MVVLTAAVVTALFGFSAWRGWYVGDYTRYERALRAAQIGGVMTALFLWLALQFNSPLVWSCNLLNRSNSFCVKLFHPGKPH